MQWNQPKTVSINTDGITPEQKATAKFKSAYREMYERLTAPGFAQVLCAHEAAHIIFFSIMAKRELPYNALRARLVYDPTITDYTGSLASVQLIEKPQYEGGNAWEWLYQVACGLCAGSIAARKLTPSSDGGDDGDRERFQEICHAVAANNPGVKIDVELLWERAQEAVSKILDEQPIVMEGIKAEAARIQEKLGL